MGLEKSLRFVGWIAGFVMGVRERIFWCYEEFWYEVEIVAFEIWEVSNCTAR